MIKPEKLLLVILLVYAKSTSLPKFYFNVSNRRGVTINQLRACEKHGRKVLELKLDVKYLESFEEMKVCSKFL